MKVLIINEIKVLRTKKVKIKYILENLFNLGCGSY